MTGAVAALGGGYPEVMSFAGVGTLGAGDPRSFTIGTTAAFSGGHFVCNMTAADAGPSNVESWLTDGAASNWEARATVTSGTLTTGTTGTWVQLSSNFVLTKTSGATVIVTIDVGRYGTATVLDTASVQI